MEFFEHFIQHLHKIRMMKDAFPVYEQVYNFSYAITKCIVTDLKNEEKVKTKTFSNYSYFLLKENEKEFGRLADMCRETELYSILKGNPVFSNLKKAAAVQTDNHYEYIGGLFTLLMDNYTNIYSEFAFEKIGEQEATFLAFSFIITLFPLIHQEYVKPLNFKENEKK